MSRHSTDPAQAFATTAERRRGETGSAYLAALLVLVLLTMIGLSLSLITQTELQIGANEKSIERAFYAADSGIDLATARTLVTRRPAWSEVEELPDPEKPLVQHKLDISPFFPIGSSPCNLCDINNAGEYGAKTFLRVNHAVTSIAVREVRATGTLLAEQGVTAMVEFQPWELPPEAVLAIQDETQLSKIRF